MTTRLVRVSVTRAHVDVVLDEAILAVGAVDRKAERRRVVRGRLGRSGGARQQSGSKRDQGQPGSRGSGSRRRVLRPSHSSSPGSGLNRSGALTLSRNCWRWFCSSRIRSPPPGRDLVHQIQGLGVECGVETHARARPLGPGFELQVHGEPQPHLHKIGQQGPEARVVDKVGRTGHARDRTANAPGALRGQGVRRHPRRVAGVGHRLRIGGQTQVAAWAPFARADQGVQIEQVRRILGCHRVGRSPRAFSAHMNSESA